MRITRSCLTCRASKAKCDAVRPTCGRCTRRGVACTGFVNDLDFLFRDENDTAQRNSQRARSGRGCRKATVTLNATLSRSQQMQAPFDPLDSEFHPIFPWLNARALAEVSQPVRRDLETRAVERLLSSYMNDLPQLFLSAANESILWYIVRATALADMRHYRGSDNIPFSRRALQHYGSALGRLRNIAEDEQNLANDRVLAALLLIDSFESTYLGRTEPLGPHSAAIKHILRARGEDQFLDRSRFSLWRVAHERLQAQQILLRKEPDPDQVEWVNRLDISVTNLHVSSDIQRITMLIAAAYKLKTGGNVPQTEARKKIQQATQLVNSMQELIVAIESWTDSMTEPWKPKLVDPELLQTTEMDSSYEALMPKFRCPQILNYHDIWLAYIWNLHLAGQIVLREELTDLVDFRTALEGHGTSLNDIKLKSTQRHAIEEYSSLIGRSMPQLLGFAHRDVDPPQPLPQGAMAGRYFCLFSMSVVQRARYTSRQHKEAAVEVIKWIQESHKLI